MQRSKDITFIGFSVRARKIVRGANAAQEGRERKYLFLLCFSASANTKKDITAFAARLGVPCVVTTDILLEELVNKKNCKAAALTDKALADAVRNNLSGHFTVCEGGQSI